MPKNSPIHSVAQLRGKRIAVAQGSSADYHLLTVLEKAGLSVHDVTLDYLQRADGLAALASGHVDAWDMWSPFVEQAEAQDHARLLVSGVGYGSPYSFTVAARGALAEPAKAARSATPRAAPHPGARGPPPTRPWAAVSAKATGRSAGIMTAAAKDDAARGADHPRSGLVRAAGLQRVHRGRADPWPRGLQQVRGHGVQQHRRRDVLMKLTFHWFLPTTGDGRSIMGRGHSLPRPASLASRPAPRPGRPDIRGAAAQELTPDIEYLAQVARSAEQLGFEAVLTPTGTWCEDAWLVTAALTRETRRLKFLVAFRPGLTSPTLAAQMAATYQRLSGGRLLLNVVTGGQADEQRRFGDHLSHDERYARTAEFLAIVRGAWGSQPFDFDGQYYQVEGATVLRPPDPLPGIYFGGSSAAAGPVAAGHADVYLTWGEPPDQVAEKLRWIRELAAAQGRTLRFGIRLHVITRDTEADAWAEASGCSTTSTRPRSPRRSGSSAPASRWARTGCARCTPPTGTAAPRRTWRSTRTCGPGSAWSAAARAPPWSAATRRWPA